MLRPAFFVWLGLAYFNGMLAVAGLKSQKVNVYFHQVPRTDSPITYWTVVALHGGAAVVALCFLIWA
jgi:hypothetical protein